MGQRIRKVFVWSSLVAWQVRDLHFHCCGSGHCCDAGSIPGPGTSACCGCSQKVKITQKKKKRWACPCVLVRGWAFAQTLRSGRAAREKTTVRSWTQWPASPVLQKCVFCKKRRKRAAGCCVQCSHGRCPTAFHVSCAQAAGVMMQPDDWPFVVFITCFRHKIPNLERAKGALQSITAGQKVISKHKNGRFYQCEVVRLTTETFYEVNFDDGSFSDNLYPEDIVSQDCLQLGPPAEGEVVQVRWTDGRVYGAKFVASHPIQMYQVEFEDGSQLVVKRDDVYTLDEELPKRVKSRLSVASDMRFNEIFTEKEVKQEKKRQRVINSRYREDYIEPALYRAIME
uniref:[histone H3]-trimethyl-L-lysine(9) demethylase n=1 Tax=Sus scrofa TaxID=9823 RepID=A0A8D0MSL8_PIG